MLARGWLAYPVTSMHAHLPPKSGCRNIIPRFALSRRRATALFRNPVRKAQRSVPGFSSTPTSACRRYATSPPSAVASPHRPPSSSDCANGAIHRHREKPPKSGCIIVIPWFALSRRRATALFRNPVRKAQRSVPGFSSTPTSACRRYATSPPSTVASSHRLAYPVTPCAIRRERSLRFPEAPLFALINYCFLTA